MSGQYIEPKHIPLEDEGGRRRRLEVLREQEARLGYELGSMPVRDVVRETELLDQLETVQREILGELRRVHR